jgi:L-amino acid N-acyltransferase
MHAERLVRPATEQDLQRIHDIYNHAVLTTTATWDYDPWSWQQRLDWWREHDADPTSPVFVADVDGEVAGFCYLSPFRGKIGYRYTREDTVYIDQRFQRRGIGNALLGRAVTAASECGIRAVVGAIEATNEPSLRLHQRFGFVEVARMPSVGYKFNRWLDLIYVQLTLREPPNL